MAKRMYENSNGSKSVPLLNDLEMSSVVPYALQLGTPRVLKYQFNWFKVYVRLVMLMRFFCSGFPTVLVRTD